MRRRPMIQGKTDDPDRLVRSFWWLLVKASETAYSLRHAARISNCPPSTAFDTTGIDVLGYNWITKSNYQTHPLLHQRRDLIVYWAWLL